MDDLALPMAMIGDDLRSAVGVIAREHPEGVALELDGDEAAIAQAARVLSLDVDATDYAAVGDRDPVVAGLMAAAPGLRPVLFHTPYEAGAWAILSQRVSMRQAGALRTRLGDALGEEVAVGDRRMRTFPLPQALLDAPDLPGVPSVKVERLRALAAAALEGALDAAALRALPEQAARERLLALPGIGPFSADLIQLRGVGTQDVFSQNEPRVRRAIAAAYGVDADDLDAITGITAVWRPWRTWVSVLFRALA